METTPSNVAKARSNEPHDLLSRLYREIGISAVAAALEPSTFNVEKATRPAPQKYPLAGKAAA